MMNERVFIYFHSPIVISKFLKISRTLIPGLLYMTFNIIKSNLFGRFWII